MLLQNFTRKEGSLYLHHLWVRMIYPKGTTDLELCPQIPILALHIWGISPLYPDKIQKVLIDAALTYLVSYSLASNQLFLYPLHTFTIAYFIRSGIRSDSFVRVTKLLGKIPICSSKGSLPFTDFTLP